MSAMNLFVAFFSFALDMLGMFLIVNGREKAQESVDTWSRKKTVCVVAASLGVTFCVAFLRIYLIVCLVAEFFGILWQYGRRKEDHLRNFVCGIFSLAIMGVSELTVIFLYYTNDLTDLKFTGTVDFEVQLACSIAMALIQQMILFFQYTDKSFEAFRRILMYLLMIKEIGDMAWFYIGVEEGLFDHYIYGKILLVAGLILNYGVFYVIVFRIKERTEKSKRAEMNMNAYEYYLNMEEEHLQIRKMYHDMKNKLMIMEAGNEENPEHAGTSWDSMREKLDQAKQFYHTGCTALDILLFDGQMKAKARNITFDAVISEGCLDFMDKEDITVIFGNAIMNAIEACEKIEDGPRRINIKAGKNLNDVLIYVKNTVDSSGKKESLRSAKKDPIEHGIGMTSIQESAEKYGGYVSVIREEGSFQLAILFGRE